MELPPIHFNRPCLVHYAARVRDVEPGRAREELRQLLEGGVLRSGPPPGTKACHYIGTADAWLSLAGGNLLAPLLRTPHGKYRALTLFVEFERHDAPRHGQPRVGHR
jgi:hypothetical protein